MKRVLFVGAGRRVTMAEMFKTKGFKIFSYELDKNSPISEFAEIIEGKSWDDPEILQHVSDVLKTYKFDVVIPFQDESTSILSILKNDFQEICVSSKETTDICLDKKKFEEFFISDQDLKLFYPSDDGSEVVIKPRKGYGSRGISFENKCPKNLDSNIVVQKRIYGKEISIDCYFSKDAKLVDFVPRERIQIAGGEVIKSLTLSKNEMNLSKIVELISNKIHFVGPVCMQFICEQGHSPYIMEINARFGGGSTLSLFSGLDMISMIKQEYCDKDEISDYKSLWKNDVYLNRSYRDHYYEKNSL